MIRRALLAALASGLAACGAVEANPALPVEPTRTREPAPSPTAQPTATPAAAATPNLVCSENPSWRDFTYRGVALAADLYARVYLPPCFAEAGVRYPVAYFFHGKPYTEAQWSDLGLEALLSGSPGRPAFPGIAVLVRLPEPLFSGSDGGPGSYEQEFDDGLRAAVEAEFPTESLGSGRALIGISRGGVWALEIGLRSPQEFGVVVALSPALSVNHARAPYDPMRLAAEAPDLPARVFLAAGEDDWARAQTEALAAALAGRGEDPVLRLVPGSHADPTWVLLLPEVVEFVRVSFFPEG